MYNKGYKSGPERQERITKTNFGKETFYYISILVSSSRVRVSRGVFNEMGIFMIFVSTILVFRNSQSEKKGNTRMF